MLRTNFRRAAIGAFLLLPAWSAAAVTLDQDTVIDASSPISGSGIKVIDGTGGPASVSITSGGSVVGFEGRDNSTISLDGGRVTYLSSLHDNASFVMNRGVLGCLEQVCHVIDYDADLTANDSSTLHFFGGAVPGVIRLFDSSVAHIYGENLVLFELGFIYVKGSYRNGDPIFLAFHPRPDIRERVILHNVPEPAAASICIVLTGVLFGLRQVRRPASFRQ